MISGESTVLLILVDGLRAASAQEPDMPFVGSLSTEAMVPGVGFSVNIHREILSGETPDRAGFLNYWGKRPDSERRQVRRVEAAGRQIADRVTPKGQGGRALRVAIQRVFKTGSLANVPFTLMPYLTVWGHDAYDLSVKSVISDPRWHAVIGSRKKGRKDLGERDQMAYQEAMELLAGDADVRNLYVLFPDTDTITHRMGFGSQLSAHLQRVDRWCSDLAEAFLRTRSGGTVVVVSDHGLATVNPEAAVSIRLEDTFGAVGPDSYIYMVDSVMLRVWTDRGELRDAIAGYLADLRLGGVLSEEQRAELGAADRQLGDIIFLLDEGRFFAPNFLSGKLPVAAHGYLPWAESQLALVACSDRSVTLPRTTVGVCDLVRDLSGSRP